MIRGANQALAPMNIYCDESTHLEHDAWPVMVLGSIWCPTERTREVAIRIREIKRQHGLAPTMEVKWTKVSPGALDAYLAVIDYFFDESNLRFRGLVAAKDGLDHRAFDQTHDDWYYKMYYVLLEPILRQRAPHYFYFDIKDTRSAVKMRKLEEVLVNKRYDFERKSIRRIQTVRSHEVEQLQVADLLIGALNYVARGLTGSPAKEALVRRVQERSGLDLTHATRRSATKFNLFFWHGQAV